MQAGNRIVRIPGPQPWEGSQPTPLPAREAAFRKIVRFLRPSSSVEAGSLPSASICPPRSSWGIVRGWTGMIPRCSRPV